MARICLIRQGVVPLDARVTREVGALIAAGHEVDLICQRWADQPRRERLGRLTAYRLPISRKRGGALRSLAEYAAFLAAAALVAGALHLRRRYDVVQVNSMPDCLVFAAMVPRLLGARVVLDLHECMPEFFATKFKVGMGHPLVRLLIALERASIGFADSVLTCTEQMRERFIERGAPAGKIAVILNAANEEVFDPQRYPARHEDGRFVLVCHGSIDDNYSPDVVIRAIALIADRIPGLRLLVYGDGPRRAATVALSRELGLRDRVWFSGGWAPMDDLVRAIAEADAGIVASTRDVFRDLTHCNKMFDLIAMRKPVIATRTRAIEAYFGEGCFQMFESGDERDLARAILDLYADPDLRRRLVGRASEVSEPYRWLHQRARYLDAVGQLASQRRASVATAAAAPATTAEEA